MAEPTRKKSKSNTTVTAIPSAAPLLSKPMGDTYLQFTSSHESEPGTLDMEEFRSGYKSRKGEAYSFSGREKLILELAPFLISNLSSSPKLTIDTTRQCFRTYFRLFDSLENFTQVSSVKDLNDTHGALQVRWKIDSQVTNCFLQYVNQARTAMGLPPLFWPRYEKPSPIRESHNEKHIRMIYFEILHRVKRCMATWERADQLAAVGRVINPEQETLGVSEADLHATYRALVTKNEPCPSREKFITASGIELISPEFSKLVYGLYPSMEDTQGFFHLFLIRTGWNVSTTIDLDSAELENCVCPHTLSPDTHEIVHSVKERANSTQIAISQRRSTTSAANILRTLFSRTLPLRRSLQYPDADLNPSTTELAVFRKKTRSPWLCINKVNFYDVMHLDKLTHSRTGTGRGSYLKDVITTINLGLDIDEQIPNITAKDFRDSFIDFSYKASGYNWLVAMLAAGHKSLESLKSYLRRRRWANHSRGQIGLFLKHFWNEIIERRVVDPAILKVLVSKGTISEEQRVRWMQHRDRTRVGTGCKDVTSPPKYLVPNHQPGKVCRVQRCTLCTHGIVFEDSLPLLCRRVEELETLREMLSMVAWNQSTFPLELEATLLTLKRNFALKDITKYRKFWREEINTGRHQLQQFEGSYGSST
jgi:hypothetical protein